MTKLVRTRFAPSPTGFVHIGSLRTALFSYLYARKNGGAHILRVEDTDQNRKVEGALENLISVLKFMGVEFDEGPVLENAKIIQKGELGPYIQSERKHTGIYQKHVQELLDKKAAYYCFCSEQRLEEVRKEQMALKKPPMYDRCCRNLPADEIKIKLEKFKAEGKNPVIRFAIPLEGSTVIQDLIFGEITYDNKLLDDQVILKSDGYPTYHLAVVVDDHLMEVSHVIRGEEWIPSTPKHLLLYKAFGWKPTEFAHLPLILNPDKSKLSKRQGDVSVEDFLKKGYLKEALLNFVALLGWNPKTEQEFFSLEELTRVFDLAKVNKSGAVFDPQKLDWINSHYIRQKSNAELSEMLKPFWRKRGIAVERFSGDYLNAIAALEKERLKKLSEIGERTDYFFKAPDYSGELLVWKKSDKEKTKQALNELVSVIQKIDDDKLTGSGLEENIKQMISAKGYDNGSVLWPMRVALTGVEKSPGPFEVAATLAIGPGKQEIISRLKSAISKLN